MTTNLVRHRFTVEIDDDSIITVSTPTAFIACNCMEQALEVMNKWKRTGRFKNGETFIPEVTQSYEEWIALGGVVSDVTVKPKAKSLTPRQVNNITLESLGL